MNIPVRRTKLTVPRRRSDLLTRQRLLDLLFDLVEHTLIVVSAPAGYGKTSLLVDFAHQIEMPICWFALDTLDLDSHRFLAHLIASVSERFPGFGQQSRAALSNTDASPEMRDIDRLVTTIVNEIYEQIDEDFVIVLDDYHFVESNIEITSFLNQFVQSVDEHCHVIVSSRRLLLLPDLSLMVARGQVGGISLEELTFRTDEIRSLIFQNYHVSIPEETAQQIKEETEGWITALLLSAQTIWRRIPSQLRIARASRVGLYDYLAQQVLEQQPPMVRDFLLRTSLLHEFDASLCAEVLGPPGPESGSSWRDVMETVAQNNLFVLPIDEDGTWLRYHHLFQEFLESRIAREQPEEYERILRRLGAVYVEREAWETAYDAYDRVNDVEAVADVVEQSGPSLLRDGRLTRLYEWLDRLPRDVVAARPRLQSLFGMVSYHRGKTNQGLHMLGQAETAFRTAGDVSGLARTLVRRAVAYRFQADYRRSLSDADEALTITAEDGALSDVRAEAFRVKGLTAYRMGHVAEAALCFEESLRLYHRLDQERNAAMVLMELGITARAAGTYTAAEDCYRRSLAYWQQTGNLAWQANVLNNLGVLMHYRGAYEDACRVLEEALQCVRRSGDKRLEAYILCGFGDVYRDLDADGAALDAYEEADALAPAHADQAVMLHLHLARADVMRRAGAYGRAHEELAAAKTIIETSRSHSQEGRWYRVKGRLALAEERHEVAVAHLETAVSASADSDEPLDAAKARLMLAAAYDAAGRHEDAPDTLERLFAHVTELESRQPLIVAAREVKTVLMNANDHPGIGDQARNLYNDVEAFERRIPILRRRLRQQVTLVPFAAPELVIRALGVERVEQGDTVLESTEWPMHAARELFFCFLAHPHGLTRDAAGEYCWPDIPVEKQKWRFKNALHRVRDVLGSDVVQYEGGRYRFNHLKDYEYDVDVFLAAIDRAKNADTREEQAKSYRAAIEVYGGPYLPNVEGTWALSERERLHQKYVMALLELAQASLEIEHYAAALDSCRSALDEDPCLERGHRIAMKAYAGMGDRAAAARQFDMCRNVLQRQLGVPPSPETEAVYATLVQ